MEITVRKRDQFGEPTAAWVIDHRGIRSNVRVKRACCGYIESLTVETHAGTLESIIEILEELSKEEGLE